MAVDDGNGGSRIVTSLSNGTQHARLTDSSTPVISLTWATNDRIIYTDGTTINSVDLSHRTALLYTPPTGSGTITALAPGGAYAYISPASGTGGALLNVNTGALQPLHGAATDVACRNIVQPFCPGKPRMKRSSACCASFSVASPLRRMP